MADEKHLYCVLRGDYVSGALVTERWQIGVRLWADWSVPDDFGNLPSTGDYIAADHSAVVAGNTVTSTWDWSQGPTGGYFAPWTYLTDRATAFSTFITTANLSSQVRLREIRLYPNLAPLGNAFEGRSASLVFGTPPSGAATGNPMPTEVANVMSLRTPQVGRRGRGRVYLPIHSSAALDGTGFITTTVQSSARSATVVLLQALSANPAAPDALHVRPIVTGSPWNKYGVIREVRSGNIFDSQRRRRRQLDEVYVTTAVSY